MLGGYRVASSPETGDKVLRAEPLAAQVNVGNVSMVRGAWNATLIDELRSDAGGLSRGEQPGNRRQGATRRTACGASERRQCVDGARRMERNADRRAPI